MLYVLLGLFSLLLIAVSSVRIRRTTLSQFELRRRRDADDEIAKGLLERENHISDLQSLQRAVIALLIIIVTLVSVVAFGWVIGIIAALVISLGYGIISRQDVVNKPAQKVYDQIEPRILDWVVKVPFVFTLLRSVVAEQASDPELRSKEQLLYLVSQSRDVLSTNQKSLLRHGLAFGDKLVVDVMTPRSVIDSINADELLGPLVLNDLHKTGHSRFPVIDGDVDHIVGVLHIRDLLTLSPGKSSTTARKAMDSRVFYIREDQTLEHALSAFLKSHHHLFIVVNEYRETVGLLSLEDVIETLLGRKIIDEFDTHEDLRTVAARNPRGNNHPPKYTNV